MKRIINLLANSNISLIDTRQKLACITCGNSINLQDYKCNNCKSRNPFNNFYRKSNLFMSIGILFSFALIFSTIAHNSYEVFYVLVWISLINLIVGLYYKRAIKSMNIRDTRGYKILKKSKLILIITNIIVCVLGLFLTTTYILNQDENAAFICIVINVIFVTGSFFLYRLLDYIHDQILRNKA